MLAWIFGDVKENTVHLHTHDRAAGYLEFEKAKVKWFLSIDAEALPEAVKAKGQRTHRSITVDGEAIEFSGGFTELHSKSYEAILKGNGFGLEEARASIEIVHAIRNAAIAAKEPGKYHPFVDLPSSKHPFRRR